MTPEDSKVEMFIPTDRRRWKPEETKAPGNICGVSWKMRETPMGLLNPPAFTGAPPPMLVTEPDGSFSPPSENYPAHHVI